MVEACSPPVLLAILTQSNKCLARSEKRAIWDSHQSCRAAVTLDTARM